MANQMGFRKVYLLAPNYQAGKDAMAGFKRFFKGEVVNEVFTQVNQPDYSVELAALADARPDAAYVFFPGGMGVNFIKQYRQAGLFDKIPLLSVDTIDGATLPALQKDALGAVTNVPYSPDLDNAANKAFAAAFRQKYGREPSSYAAQSWDAAQLIGSALKRTGGKTDDKEALRKALEAADFASVRGEFRYQPNHFPVAGFFRADVAAGADGKVGFVNKGPIFADLSKVSDQYAAQCAMK